MEQTSYQDKPGFEQLYQLHVQELLQYSLRFTTDRELAKDIIQDAFVYLWQKRDKLDGIQSIKAYLITCVRREIIKREKAGHLFTNNVEKSITSQVQSPEESMIEFQVHGIRSHKISAAVKLLPVRQQEVVFLRFYSELDFAVIAKVMDIRLRSVYKVLYKALHNLKEHLDKELLQK